MRRRCCSGGARGPCPPTRAELWFGARLPRAHEKEGGMGIDGRRIVETAEVFAERLERNHDEDARLEVLVLCARVRGGGGGQESEPDFGGWLGGGGSGGHLLRGGLRGVGGRKGGRGDPGAPAGGGQRGP